MPLLFILSPLSHLQRFSMSTRCMDGGLAGPPRVCGKLAQDAKADPQHVKLLNSTSYRKPETHSNVCMEEHFCVNKAAPAHELTVP